MRNKQRRKHNHHSSKPRPEARPEAPPAATSPGATAATPPPPTPTEQAPSVDAESAEKFVHLDSLPESTMKEVLSFSNQMLKLLTERKRRLDLLLSMILHPTSSIKLKLFALKSISKMPYFRFRKRDHTDPYLLGYLPAFKAFNRELIDTFISSQQYMSDLLESGKLTTKEYLLVLEQLSKLPIPNLRMQDHCDNPIPSPSNKPATEAPTPEAQSEADSDADPEADTNAPDPTDHADTENVQNVQIVQNRQIVQNAHNQATASNAPAESDLTLAHC